MIGKRSQHQTLVNPTHIKELTYTMWFTKYKMVNFHHQTIGNTWHQIFIPFESNNCTGVVASSTPAALPPRTCPSGAAREISELPDPLRPPLFSGSCNAPVKEIRVNMPCKIKWKKVKRIELNDTDFNTHGQSKQISKLILQVPYQSKGPWGNKNMRNQP